MDDHVGFPREHDRSARSLNDELRALLQLLSRELQAFGPAGYVARPRDFEDMTVGRHCRHIGEHVEALLDALEEDCAVIDYDRRERDPDFETRLHVGLQRLARCVERLESARSLGDMRLRVRREGEATQELHATMESSLSRELGFLIAHTVHHGAMIALLMRVHAHRADPRLWTAASTRTHAARQSHSDAGPQDR